MQAIALKNRITTPRVFGSVRRNTNRGLSRITRITSNREQARSYNPLFFSSETAAGSNHGHDLIRRPA